MMQQIKVAVPDELRLILEARAQSAGTNMSEEARELMWVGLATMTIKPVTSEWAKEAALTHAAWINEALK